MTCTQIRRRRSLPVLMLLALAVALAFGASPATVQADPGGIVPAPAAPGVAYNFGPELQAMLEDGLSAHMAAGKLLANAGVYRLAQAWCSVDMTAADAKQALHQCGAENEDFLAGLVAEKDVESLTHAFRATGDGCANVEHRYLLRGLQFWMWRTDAGKQIKTQQVLDFAMKTGGMTEEHVVAALQSDYEWNRMPETWSHEIKGKLEMIDGARVLTVWGTNFERGYAHGRLLAREIFALWAGYALPISQYRGGGYQNVCDLQDVVFEFEDESLEEMKGLVAGMRDAIPHDERIKMNPLGRDIELVDMKVGNTLSDWTEFGCSSVTCWGDKTADGRVLTARNLDYPTVGRTLNKYHLIIVYPPMTDGSPHGKRDGWVSMTFAGAIGCYTGMNTQGVTAMMHNTFGHYSRTVGITPRAFSQRCAIELADAANMPDSFATALRDRHHLVPANVHTSWPRINGQIAEGGHAAAMEMDGATSLHGGVTVRRPEHNPAGSSRDWFVVTNHFCQRFREVGVDEKHTMPRIPGDSERRLRTLQEAAQAAADKSVTPDVLQAWLREVAHSGTVHSVIFSPDTREIYALQPGVEDKGGPWVEPKKFNVRDLMKAAEQMAAAEVEDF